MSRWWSFGLCLVVSALLVIAWGAPVRAESLDPARFKGQDRITLNNITIDKKKKEIRVQVKLAITKGILEFLLVEERGKTYESVFKVAGNPASELNFGLLLLGLEPLGFNTLAQAVNNKIPVRDLMKAHPNSFVTIDILQNGRRVPYSSLLVDREKGGRDFVWAYTGGFMTNENRFSADVMMSWIGIWGAPGAMLNLYSTRKNPYRGPFGLEINKNNKALKVDQPYELVLRPRKPR